MQAKLEKLEGWCRTFRNMYAQPTTIHVASLGRSGDDTWKKGGGSRDSSTSGSMPVSHTPTVVMTPRSMLAAEQSGVMRPRTPPGEQPGGGADASVGDASIGNGWACQTGTVTSPAIEALEAAAAVPHTPAWGVVRAAVTCGAADKASSLQTTPYVSYTVEVRAGMGNKICLDLP